MMEYRVVTALNLAEMAVPFERFTYLQKLVRIELPIDFDTTIIEQLLATAHQLPALAAIDQRRLMEATVLWLLPLLMEAVNAFSKEKKFNVKVGDRVRMPCTIRLAEQQVNLDALFTLKRAKNRKHFWSLWIVPHQAVPR